MIAKIRRKALDLVGDPGLRGALVSITVRIAAAFVGLGLQILLARLMALAAVGLVASQAWLAWVIWKALGSTVPTPTTWAVLCGLVLTFALSTVSGFMLGGKQPPAGVGWPVVGWHTWQDLRPAHFLAVHAQQFIPLAGLLAERVAGQAAVPGVIAFTFSYLAAWVALSVMGMSG